MPHPQTSPGDKIVAFAPVAARVRRPEVEADGERGTILLFTGIRYARMADADEADADEPRPDRRDDIWA